MVLQSDSNNMKKIDEIDFKFARRALICIAIGTASGLFVYEIFLYFNIAIFGWNLGLIFAPLAAGYVETIIANKIIGKNLGAKSAFILFIDTTIYSFILKNPSLGFNFITIGSIFVILQAAFPTLVNHIILVVIGGFISEIVRRFRKIRKKINYYINKRNATNGTANKTEIIPFFNENKSNERLNSLNFFFITSSDILDKKHEIIGLCQSHVVLERKSHIGEEIEQAETIELVKIKQGKDECLIKLAKQIREIGGNGILDLSMNYSLIGLKGDEIQITATGIGVKILA